MADEIKYNIAVTGTSQAATNINAVAVAQQNLTRSSANAGIALQNLNFVIRDSPYFFRDFSLGILAVGNNLNPLIDSMLRMKREAQEVGQTLSGALWASLKGPAGVVLAFSALVTVLQAVTFAMAKTKSSAKETKDEIRELRDELQKLTREQLQSGLARAKTEFQAELFNVPDVQRRQMLLGRIPMTDELKRLDERIKAYEKEIFMLGDIENVENRLRINRQRLKDLNKDNLALYKDVATTYDDIKNRLEQWIRADERALKVTKDKTEAQKDYLDMVALGYAFATEREEDLFQKRMDLLKYIRESAIRGGVSPEQAEAFAVGMSGKLQGEKPGLPVGFKKLPEHPLKDFWKDQDKGNNLLKEGTYWAHQFGRELVDAFKDGKFEADKFFNSLLAIVAELSLTNLITGIFTGGTGEGGLFTSFKPSADTSSISSNGSLDKNVTFVFENVIDGQKIIYKGIKEKQAALR